MPEATTNAPPADEKVVKVRMEAGGFDQTHGKFRAGGVYEFPQEQAIRYCLAGVGKPAPATAKTAREEDRVHLLRDAAARASREGLDQEMSAVWDVNVRDVERQQFELQAAQAAVGRAEDAVKVGKKAQAAHPVVSE